MPARVENETSMCVYVCVCGKERRRVWKRARGQAGKGKQAGACHLAQRETRSQPRHVSNSRRRFALGCFTETAGVSRLEDLFSALPRAPARDRPASSALSSPSCSSSLASTRRSFDLSLTPSERAGGRANERLERALAE